MAQGTVSKFDKVPVVGTQFKVMPGQDVYILTSDDEIKEGIVIECGSFPNGKENFCRVENSTTRVRTMYPEAVLIGRRYMMFDKLGNAIEGKIFYSKQEAIDAEEDLGYDNLSTQYHAADGKPLVLISDEIEVWEVNDGGVRIGEAIALT
jgi:hypothetical protein